MGHIFIPTLHTTTSAKKQENVCAKQTRTEVDTKVLHVRIRRQIYYVRPKWQRYWPWKIMALRGCRSWYLCHSPLSKRGLFGATRGSARWLSRLAAMTLSVLTYSISERFAAGTARERHARNYRRCLFNIVFNTSTHLVCTTMCIIHQNHFTVWNNEEPSPELWSLLAAGPDWWWLWWRWESADDVMCASSSECALGSELWLCASMSSADDFGAPERRAVSPSDDELTFGLSWSTACVSFVRSTTAPVIRQRYSSSKLPKKWNN